jgi:hypothetical protein
MTGLSLQLKSIEEKTYNRISILEQKMDMGEKVKEEVSTLKTGLVNDVKAEIKLSLQNNIRTELKEIEDQKQRGLNLIIFNVPESKSENSLERKKFDKDIFTELCNAIEVVEADVKVSFRLGNPRKETNRPLKLVMNNKKHRKDIIENAPKLKVLPQTSRLAKCIIAKDLTIRQRGGGIKRKGKRKSKMEKRNPLEMIRHIMMKLYIISRNAQTK